VTLRQRADQYTFIAMPRFAANLSLLYNEHPFLDRFGAAAQDGFQGVEFLFPYAFAAADIAAQLQAHGLQQVLMNAPPGDWDAGERGIACLPGREAEFCTGFASALEYARVLDCPRIHVLAGLVPPGADPVELEAVYTSNLLWAAGQAAAAGKQVLIEPINTRDFPGYFLQRQEQAHAIVQAVGAPNLKVQFDLYHCQIMEGDVAIKIRHYLPTGNVGHFQIAGVPGRHEPDVGELNYPYLLDVIDEVSAACGWDGWVGCEYRPRRGVEPGATREGLGWLQRRSG
jgi:hydroxypyruvate isomerase